MKNTESKFISDFGETSFKIFKEVAWPSGLRRWFKAPVSSEAWVRIPPLPDFFFVFRNVNNSQYKYLLHSTEYIYVLFSRLSDISINIEV